MVEGGFLALFVALLLEELLVLLKALAEIGLIDAFPCLSRRNALPYSDQQLRSEVLTNPYPSSL